MKKCCYCEKEISSEKEEVYITNYPCHRECFDQNKEVIKHYFEARKLQYKQNNYSEALKEINNFLKAKKDSIMGMGRKAAILGSLGRQKESQQYAKKAYKKFDKIHGIKMVIQKVKDIPNYEYNPKVEGYLVPILGDLLHTLALNYMHSKKYEEAIPILKQELELYPKHIPAIDGLAKCYYQLGQKQKVAPLYEKSLIYEGVPPKTARQLTQSHFPDYKGKPTEIQKFFNWVLKDLGIKKKKNKIL